MIRVPRSGPGRPRSKPVRVIGDKAYDSDAHRERLAKQGIELIAPNRSNRGKTQDGRSLRRYRRRWVVERTLSWIRAVSPIGRSLRPRHPHVPSLLPYRVCPDRPQEVMKPILRFCRLGHRRGWSTPRRFSGRAIRSLRGRSGPYANHRGPRDHANTSLAGLRVVHRERQRGLHSRDRRRANLRRQADATGVCLASICESETMRPRWCTRRSS
jgi:transposase